MADEKPPLLNYATPEDRGGYKLSGCFIAGGIFVGLVVVLPAILMTIADWLEKLFRH